MWKLQDEVVDEVLVLICFPLFLLSFAVSPIKYPLTQLCLRKQLKCYAECHTFSTDENSVGMWSGSEFMDGPSCLKCIIWWRDNASARKFDLVSMY